jgi:hypothetical protein
VVRPLERLALDDHVWAYRLGDVVTVANLSGAPAPAVIGTGSDWSVLLSTRPGREGSEVPGGLSLEPWEAVVLVTGQGRT